jgi:biotin transport system substrate-specific component
MSPITTVFFTRSTHLNSKWASLLAFFPIVFGSLVLGGLAQMNIPLPFTPVPITLQTLGVMGLGALLGSRKGALAVLLYLIEGCLGLPVFTGGSSGFIVFLQPTGGYLLGFVVQAYLVGLFIEKGKGTILMSFLALFGISLVQLAMGALWLSIFVGFHSIVFMGIFPFLVGDVLKCLVVLSYINFRRV